jgi:hypothetical protein
MIMSKTNSESREVRESRELTNDELAPVVGGRNEAQEGFKDAKAAFARGDVWPLCLTLTKRWEQEAEEDGSETFCSDREGSSPTERLTPRD